MLTSLRSEKSRFGSTRELCENEVETLLHPTINLPVCVALYDLGEPRKTNKGEDLSDLKEKHKKQEEHESSESVSP